MVSKNLTDRKHSSRGIGYLVRLGRGKRMKMRNIENENKIKEKQL
jgi:hypothetical protein